MDLLKWMASYVQLQKKMLSFSFLLPSRDAVGLVTGMERAGGHSHGYPNVVLIATCKYLRISINLKK